ncbi:hypothetical protein [Geotoga petraea]|uniref:Glycerophosphoryl diester phosphodiesterase n=1 Tax=Geotoga petraea TaxID=28234 RepID=A0A4Z0W2L2_9BACT|nr:hypothetical protein [Geotoga petraea]MDK2945705.1 glycerophosphoryl diester phosphodiesterase [Geotoga sp.]TGG89273.1 hypothetical protein E4650_03535 [Geotoga petraea]
MNLNYPVIVLGQKGMIDKYDENSMEGLLKSIEYGADGVTIDAMKIADNNIIICNPNSSKALKKDLKNLTTKEITKMKFTNNQKIHSLEKAFIELPSDTLININVYEEDAITNIIGMINTLDVSNRTMLSTDNINIIKYLSDLNNDFFYAFRVKEEKVIKEALELKDDLRFYSINIDYEEIKKCGLDKFKNEISVIQEESLKIMIENFNDCSKLEDLKNYVDILETREINNCIEILEKIY